MLRPILVACALALSACGQAATTEPPAVAPPRHTPAAAPLVSAPDLCPMPDSGFECELQRRIKAVQEYAETRPGSVGIVLRDRESGAMWRNGNAGDLTWTASTIKLAIAVNLLERHRAGKIRLSNEDRRLMTAMLHSSDADATDTLWRRYGGTTFNASFANYGMTELVAQKGYSATFPYWGFEKCTTNDLDRLINHVLDTVPAEDRAYLVGQMREVGPEQQWGVWGPDSGAKNGWAEEDSGWVVNSVGFVGPAERYTLAIMNDLKGQGGYDEGRATSTEITRLLFR
ncbi:serine hydrolase [Lentzea xinjiangensis]|nr:serine hydrolase [Lentzea xinjiangensis]